jgi:hypothetical protein
LCSTLSEQTNISHPQIKLVRNADIISPVRFDFVPFVVLEVDLNRSSPATLSPWSASNRASNG